MIITYTAVDGYSLSDTATGAWLMSDTAASMVTDQTGNSPLKNLTSNGSPTTAVVATNSTTLGASTFSASNYYSMSYDSAFDPGTTGLSAKIWFKIVAGDGSTRVAFDRHTSGATGAYYRLYKNTSNYLVAEIYDGTTTRSATTPVTYDDNTYHCAAFVFDGTDLDLYIDGEFSVTATGSALNTLSNGTAILRVGRAAGSTNHWDANYLAGFELDIGVQWTAQEIKSKYESESVLFDQLETFSIVGQSLEYEIDLLNASTGYQVSENFTETLNGTRSGLTWYRKKVFSCSTIPFARSALPEAMKFIKSTNNISFTYDERGTSSAADNPITVYKTSQSEQVSYANPYYQFSFSLREV